MKGIPLGGGFAVLAVLGLAAPAHAWKPYTHNTSALEAYNDAVDDGMVRINGRDYAVDPRVVTALRNWPAFYNAGVIGPDGFPDLTYGQSVIHPEQTGAWLRHVLGRAWAAQSTGISNSQKEQILAFAYGFLTHAAGDMWGHTFVNDFARGVFPGVGEILSSADKASIAVRHIVVEGYIGDGTPGYDGFQHGDSLQAPRAPAPSGDFSDDSTPGFAYDAPHDFIYSTLIDRNAGTPLPDRGPIIGFFFGLRDGLALLASATPLQDALSDYSDLVAAAAEVREACDFDDIEDVVNCPIALAKFALESIEEFFEIIGSLVLEAALAVLDSYLGSWMGEIDAGLQDWSEMGLASTKGLFDAQTRRNQQNDDCHTLGDDATSDSRASCEAGVGMLDVLLESADPFINDHLLSMLGLPPIVGELRSVLNTILDAVDDVINALLMPINPVREALTDLKEFAKDLLQDALSEILGVDIEALSSFLTQPSRWVCTDTTVFRFPGIGDQTISLFPDDEHDRLDGLLAFGHEHHVDDPSLPLGCGRLTDTTEFSPMASLPALHNTITTAKLLLLDGNALNQLLGDILGRTIVRYGAGQNLMVEALAGVVPGSSNWLLSIDGDHAWRKDGLPRFCDEGGFCPAGADARPADLNGGAGNFPVWESCVLRPAFRALFSDWEGDGFPEHQDDVSADDADDPEAPASHLARTGTFFSDGSRDFVAADNQFTQTAHDGPASFAYRDDQLGLRRRVHMGSPGPWVAVQQGDTFKLAGPDGAYDIDIQSADACHRFDGLPSPPEPVQTSTFFLDTTAPVVTCQTPPFGQEFDTADTTTVDFAIADGSIGSGIASHSATIDGYLALPGVVSTSDGAPLDLFFFYPGTRQVMVSAADNLGNAGLTTCAFELHATPESLLANVNRAFAEGLIRGAGIAQSLRQKLQQVLRLHERGAHAVEHNVLRAFIHELQAQRGHKVHAGTADRFVAFALDRIGLGR